MIIDNKLKWDKQAKEVSKKINKRMFFLRKLNYFHVDKTILELFYTSTIQSIITFCIIAWGGNVTAMNKQKIDKVVKRASKLINTPLLFFDDLLSHLSLKKILSIENSDHPLSCKIVRSVRTNRPIFVKCRTVRYSKSFIPFSTKLIVHRR